MADEATKALLSQVRTKKSIPGLSLASVVPNFIQIEFGDKINAIEDADERAKYQSDLNDYYMNGDGKATLQTIMDDMQYYYNIANTIIQQVNTTAAQMTAMNLIPSTLVAGSATGTANPGWVAPHNSFLKGSLSTQLLVGKDALGCMLEKAILIHFNIAPVATVLSTLATTAEAVINAIV